MARINIEECWWSDVRRSALIRLMGDEDLADAAAIRAWRLAQEFWGRNRQLVPKQIWSTFQAAPKLIQAGLAEEREEGIYVRGSSQYLDWHAEKRAAAQKGGKKSAQRPRNAKGQLIKIPKQNPSKNQAEPKESQASGSGSHSDSGSGSGSGSGGREPLAPAKQVFKTSEELQAAISLVDRERWAKDYPDPNWVTRQIDLCFRHHTSVPSETPRTKGHWMQKLQTWLEIGWSKRGNSSGPPKSGDDSWINETLNSPGPQ
ncbi:MAG: hypothetical protein AB7G93_09675 [Bdellovibrionales bacterium]